MPKKFTLTELQLVHEAILGEALDKRNFRRKISQKGIVKPVQEWMRNVETPLVGVWLSLGLSSSSQFPNKFQGHPVRGTGNTPF